MPRPPFFSTTSSPIFLVTILEYVLCIMTFSPELQVHIPYHLLDLVHLNTQLGTSNSTSFLSKMKFIISKLLFLFFLFIALTFFYSSRLKLQSHNWLFPPFPTHFKFNPMPKHYWLSTIPFLPSYFPITLFLKHFHCLGHDWWYEERHHHSQFPMSLLFLISWILKFLTQMCLKR